MAKEDLKAIIQHAGPPTFFFTFSAADMHWPELHFLFGNERDEGITGSLSEIRRNNVINNPHIVDWFFTERLKKFIKHWLYDSLDATWHWYRFEYQSRGSIHCHGVAKLNNDPGLCKLILAARSYTNLSATRIFWDAKLKLHLMAIWQRIVKIMLPVQ